MSISNYYPFIYRWNFSITSSCTKTMQIAKLCFTLSEFEQERNILSSQWAATNFMSDINSSSSHLYEWFTSSFQDYSWTFQPTIEISLNPITDCNIQSSIMNFGKSFAQCYSLCNLRNKLNSMICFVSLLPILWSNFLRSFFFADLYIIWYQWLELIKIHFFTSFFVSRII